MRVFLLFTVFLLQGMQTFADNTLIPNVGDKQYGQLGQKFQMGTLQLYDLPVYLKYLTEKLVWVAGLLAVLAVIWGSYKYLLGGFTGDASDAKNVFKNVAIGLAFVVFAWMIIDLIVRLTTE